MIAMGLLNCSKKNTKIEKYFSSEGTSSFVTKDFKSKDLYFENDILIGEVNYAYNNWQVYDSVYYYEKNNLLCKNIYVPRYKGRIIIGYELKDTDCGNNNNINLTNNKLTRISDDFRLSKYYLKDLELLLNSKPLKVNENKYEFEKGLIPSIFSDYGIPFDENLFLFTFSIDSDNLIKSDFFEYDNYNVERLYSYRNSFLNEVNIIVTNKKNNKIRNYKEQFKIVN